MTNIESKYYDMIKESIENMTASEQIELHNNYCEEINDMDSYIYSMNDFDEIMNGMTPWEIVRTCYYGDFCPARDYFTFNGYGNAVSFDFPDEQIFISDIVDYIIRNEDSLYNDEIQDLLDEMTEEIMNEEEDENED